MSLTGVELFEVLLTLDEGDVLVVERDRGEAFSGVCGLSPVVTDATVDAVPEVGGFFDVEGAGFPGGFGKMPIACNSLFPTRGVATDFQTDTKLLEE